MGMYFALHFGHPWAFRCNAVSGLAVLMQAARSRILYLGSRGSCLRSGRNSKHQKVCTKPLANVRAAMMLRDGAARWPGRELRHRLAEAREWTNPCAQRLLGSVWVSGPAAYRVGPAGDATGGVRVRTKRALLNIVYNPIDATSPFALGSALGRCLSLVRLCVCLYWSVSFVWPALAPTLRPALGRVIRTDFETEWPLCRIDCPGAATGKGSRVSRGSVLFS